MITCKRMERWCDMIKMKENKKKFGALKVNSRLLRQNTHLRVFDRFLSLLIGNHQAIETVQIDMDRYYFVLTSNRLHFLHTHLFTQNRTVKQIEKFMRKIEEWFSKFCMLNRYISKLYIMLIHYQLKTNG